MKMSVKKRSDHMLDEQRDSRTAKRAKNRNCPIVALIREAFSNPLILVSAAFGSLFAHFVLGPLIFK